MKPIKNIVLVLLGLTLTLGACKEKINIDLADANPILVVEGEVTTEMDSSYVKLTLSSNYYSPAEPSLVTTANVSVNGIPFPYDAARNLYRPALGFVGKADSIYNLNIDLNGKTYTAKSKLEKMFQVDSFFQTWKEAQGFLPAGYAVSYAAIDKRPPVKYTYYVQGYFDTIAQRDSFDNNQILFDNALTPANVPYVFEIPFVRLQSGEEYLAIFRSVDKNMYDFINAFGSQNPDIPGPFQVPPANLPTNVTGGAVGYFTGYDVQRWRYKVK